MVPGHGPSAPLIRDLGDSGHRVLRRQGEKGLCFYSRAVPRACSVTGPHVDEPTEKGRAVMTQCPPEGRSSEPSALGPGAGSAHEPVGDS